MDLGRIIFRWVIALLVLGALGFLGFQAYLRTQPSYYWQQAEAALAKGDRQAAILHLRNLLNRRGNDVQAHLRLAELLTQEARERSKIDTLRSPDVPAALDHLLAAAAAEPENLELQQRILDELLDSGRLTSAVEVASRVSQLDPKNADAQYMAAWRALNGGDRAAALRELDKLDTLEPGPSVRSLALRTAATDAAETQDAFQQALESCVEGICRLTAKDLEALRTPDRRLVRDVLALSVLRAADGPTAEARFRRVLSWLDSLREASVDGVPQLGPSAELVVAIWDRLTAQFPPRNGAEVDTRRELMQAASALVEAAIDAKAGTPAMYHFAARTALASGADEKGLRLLTAGIKQGEATLADLRQQIDEDRRQNRTDRARQQQLAQQERQVLQLRELAARRLIALRRFTEAEQHIKPLLADEQTAGWGHLIAGVLATEERRLQRALDHLLLARKMLGDSIYVHLALAHAYINLRQWADALPHLDALQMDPAKLDPEQRAWLGSTLGSGGAVHLLQAQALLSLDRWDAAQPHLAALRGTPQEPRGEQLRAAYYWTKGRTEDALNILRAAHARHPDDLGVLLTLASTLLRLNQGAEAGRLIAGFASGHADNLAAQLLVARWYAEQSQPDAALAWLDQVAPRFNNAPAIDVLRAQLLLEQGKSAEALAIAETLKQHADTAGVAALLGAQAALKEQKLGLAADLLAQTDPDMQRSGFLQLWRGELAAAQQDYETAITSLASSLTAAPTEGQARVRLFSALLELARQESPARALERVDELRREHPREPVLLLARVELCTRLLRFDDVQKTLDELEALDPRGPLGPYFKAQSWVSRNRADRALEELARALQADPRHLPSLALGARLHLDAGRPAEALDLSLRALRENPQLVNMYAVQAAALQQLNRGQEARSVLEALVQSQPNMALAYTLLADFYAAAGDRVQALAAITRGRKALPDNLAIAQTEISLLVRCSREEAAQQAAAELAGDPPDAVRTLAVGRAFHVAGRQDLAQQWAERALAAASDEQRPQVQWLLGDIHLQRALAAEQQGQAAEAQAAYEQAADAYAAAFAAQPQNFVVGNNLAWIQAVKFNRPEQALETANKVRQTIAQGVMPPELVDTLATIYLSLNQPEEARRVVDQALQLVANDAKLLRLSSQLYLAAAEFSQARKELDKLELLLPASAEPILLKARSWLSEGRIDPAIAELERGLDLHPRDLGIRSLLAELYLARRRDSDALLQANETVRLNPQAWEAYLTQAEALWRTGQQDQALAVLRSLLNNQPGMTAARTRLARRLADRGDAAAALALLREGRSLAPTDLDLLAAEVKLLAEQNRQAEAAQLLEAFAGEQPSLPTCLGLGHAAMNAGLFDAAQAWADRALEQAPAEQRADAQLLLAEIAMRQGQQKKDASRLQAARQHYEQVLAAYPTHMVAGNNLAWLLAVDLNEPRPALELALRVRGNLPVSRLPVNFIDTLATVLRRNQRYQEARDLLEEAVGLFPTEALVQLQLGLTYAAIDNPQGARAALETALQLGLPDERVAEARAALAAIKAEGESG
ncbi:MAG: tetratricopeptide repeat protein [Pirellulales bacterium]|nr:tetratricopeptide repeat protein [Pirellulales bacterium]